MIERRAVNPWTWQDRWGYSQAWLVEGASRHLHVAGQGAFDERGALLHPGDVAAQSARALDNLETVLRSAGMAVSDVVSVRGYVTDMGAFQRTAGAALASFFAERGVRPALTVVEVSRLGVEGMEVEIEACAAT